MPKVFTESLNSTARLFILKSLFSQNTHPIFLLTASEKEKATLLAWDTIFLENSIKPIDSISSLLSFSNRELKGASEYFLINTNILRSNENLYALKKNSIITLAIGDTDKSLEAVIENIMKLWYEFSTYGGEPYTYKKEWWILHIVMSTSKISYQIEWFDTEIDSIIETNEETQKKRKLTEIHIEKNTHLSDIHSTNQQPMKIQEELVDFFKNISSNSEVILIWWDFISEYSLLQKIATIQFPEIIGRNWIQLWLQIPSIHSIQDFIEVIKTAQAHSTSIHIISRFSQKVRTFLEENNLENIEVIETSHRNFESFQTTTSSPEFLKPSLYISDDIIGKIFVKNRTTRSIAKNLDLLLTLAPGDYVVHRDHGIGKFEAVTKKTLWSLEREYIEIHYKDDDKLFVPITEIFRISKYLWNDSVELTNLKWKEWEKTLKKTDEEIQLIAENILETNAKRALSVGKEFGQYRELEKQFREEFPHEYTPDQLQWIYDVFEDMESPLPMDRLISWDVGFWKTEIAMNAAYKAVLSGTQVAVISPLVVLAMEHYESFVERLEKHGIKVALLSRMNTKKESEEILKSMKSGTIDIVIGTHRLLSEDVHWKKLGLLIIDEEHKFWVLHKERIKQMRAGIDILSLSATPIPRSLNLALSGVKKISLLTTPPKQKKPIETIITSWNTDIVREAIEFELNRSGQVLIIHNRIAWLDYIKLEMESLISSTFTPRIAVTHGRMNSDDIDTKIHDFKQWKYNILLTTTIIENGVNFLSANTIIIIDPEEFWLASLHQLRGRVWRQWLQGYCYLAYRKYELTEGEKERLLTIANNNKLGSGFEISMRDMEIRWAGDILWIKQSGNSKEVGLPLYFRMLEEKIAELRHEKSHKILTKIELDISYILPDSIFQSELDKLNFFRQAENIESLEELETFQEEFDTTDENIENFFLFLKARIVFSEYYAQKISKNGNYYVIDFKVWNSVERLKKFLDRFDTHKDAIVVSLEKIRFPTRLYANPKKFLQTLIS